jgi:hypothetical protein
MFPSLAEVREREIWPEYSRPAVDVLRHDNGLIAGCFPLRVSAQIEAPTGLKEPT